MIFYSILNSIFHSAHFSPHNLEMKETRGALTRLFNHWRSVATIKRRKKMEQRKPRKVSIGPVSQYCWCLQNRGLLESSGWEIKYVSFRLVQSKNCERKWISFHDLLHMDIRKRNGYLCQNNNSQSSIDWA